jgi:hypothetical protein
MTTLLTFRTQLRTELQDPGPTFVWSDAQLNGYINDGLNQLSIDLPPLKLKTQAAVNGQRDYTLAFASDPVGPRGIHSVEYPVGFVKPQGDTSLQYFGAVGAASSTYFNAYDQCWELIEQAGDSQILRFRYNLTDTQNMLIKYWSIYTLPTGDAAVLDVSVFDEVALKWFSCGRALAWLDEVRGKRSGQSVAGNRGSQGYYQRLYNSAIQARKTAAGVKTAFLTPNV